MMGTRGDGRCAAARRDRGVRGAAAGGMRGAAATLGGVRAAAAAAAACGGGRRGVHQVVLLVLVEEEEVYPNCHTVFVEYNWQLSSWRPGHPFTPAHPTGLHLPENFEPTLELNYLNLFFCWKNLSWWLAHLHTYIVSKAWS